MIMANARMEQHIVQRLLQGHWSVVMKPKHVKMESALDVRPICRICVLMEIAALTNVCSAFVLPLLNVRLQNRNCAVTYAVKIHKGVRLILLETVNVRNI